MIFGVLCWIILGIGVYACAAPRIRERNVQKGMMDHIYSIHGHLLPSGLCNKAVSYSTYAGYGVTSSGEFTHYYQPRTGSVSVGFIACIGDGHGTIIDAYQLPRSDQSDPFFTLPRNKRDGTMRYVIDKNGKHYFIDFTPDD